MTTPEELEAQAEELKRRAAHLRIEKDAKRLYGEFNAWRDRTPLELYKAVEAVLAEHTKRRLGLSSNDFAQGLADKRRSTD